MSAKETPRALEAGMVVQYTYAGPEEQGALVTDGLGNLWSRRWDASDRNDTPWMTVGDSRARPWTDVIANGPVTLGWDK